jgi:hypothetical protein
MTDPSTRAQLPRHANEYYAQSVKSDVFEYQDVGRDGCGRRVYQKFLNGEAYGMPRALLNYREYAAKVEAFARISSYMGVQRWTDPYPSE